MKKGGLFVAALLSLGLAACAVFRRPFGGPTMEMRPIAPVEEARIRSAAADAQEAAMEQQARLAGRKTAP